MISIMPRLPYTTNGFTSPELAPKDVLEVSLPQLLWAAMTVGALPAAMGGKPRPLVELCWRVALTDSNLEHGWFRGELRWAKSDAFKRLDPSEKSAISYFLGMTQAKLTSAMLLDVPHLVHLDALLASTGRPRSQSRPDLVGVAQPSLDRTVFIEAKGRTGQWTSALTTAASNQARSIPSGLCTGDVLSVASLSTFAGNGSWRAHLEAAHPPEKSTHDAGTGELLVSYYQPLIAAMSRAGVDDGPDQYKTAYLADIDVTLGAPAMIYAALSDEMYADSGGISPDLAGILLDAVVTTLDATMDEHIEENSLSFHDPLPVAYTGADGIRVELGETWWSDSGGASSIR